MEFSVTSLLGLGVLLRQVLPVFEGKADHRPDTDCGRLFLVAGGCGGGSILLLALLLLFLLFFLLFLLLVLVLLLSRLFCWRSFLIQPVDDRNKLETCNSRLYA